MTENQPNPPIDDRPANPLQNGDPDCPFCAKARACGIHIDLCVCGYESQPREAA